MNSLQKAKLAVISGITICVASLGFIAMSGAQAISKTSADSLPVNSYGLSKAEDCSAIGGGKSCLKKQVVFEGATTFKNLPAIAIVSTETATTQLIKGEQVLVATQ